MFLVNSILLLLYHFFGKKSNPVGLTICRFWSRLIIITPQRHASALPGKDFICFVETAAQTMNPVQPFATAAVHPCSKLLPCSTVPAADRRSLPGWPFAPTAECLKGRECPT